MKLGVRPARRRRRGFIAAAAALAVGATLMAAPAGAETGGGVTAQAVDPCPAPVPIADVKAATVEGGPGMVGEGLTVVKGTQPRAFQVNVLGVLDGGIRPGRDLVMFEIADVPGQADILNKGVWAGMSGSPVYVDGKLLGAISYGFTWDASPIGGITPAADMMDVLNLTPAGVAAVKARTKVSLTATQRKAIDARATADVPNGAMPQLRTPLSVSGLGSKRVASLQRALDKAGKSFVAYSGGRVGAASGPPTAPVPGANFAAVISSGDFSAAGVGTTTAVCGNKVLAFGHPMDYIGQSTYGANAASAIAVIKDTGFGGSFKMANVGESFGTVDQDRVAAIRATVGAGPTTTKVSSTITNLDNGKTRPGTTDVAVPDYLAMSTALGLWGNYDSTFDKWGKGLATSSWTIRGTRAGGKPFVLSRGNTWSDLGDVTNDPVFEVADAVDALVSNEYEPVKITSVDFQSKASSAYENYRITKIAVSANGGKYKSGVVKVKPKSTLKLRVTYRGYHSTTDRSIYFNLGKVSKRYAKKTGSIVVTGGQSGMPSDDEDDEGLDDELSCLLEDCDDPAGALDAVMSDITSAPANNAVRAYIGFGGVDPEVDDPTAKTGTSAPVSGVKAIVLKVKKK